MGQSSLLKLNSSKGLQPWRAPRLAVPPQSEASQRPEQSAGIRCLPGIFEENSGAAQIEPTSVIGAVLSKFRYGQSRAPDPNVLGLEAWCSGPCSGIVSIFLNSLMRTSTGTHEGR